MEFDYVSLIVGSIISIGSFVAGLYFGKRESLKIIQKITQNAIDLEKHKESLPSMQGIKVNRDNKVVREINATFTARYNIEQPQKRSPI